MNALGPNQPTPVAANTDTGVSSSNLIENVASSFEESFATQVALQEIMLDYQIRSESLRSISEGVQKNIDVVENERQDISQSQE